MGIAQGCLTEGLLSFLINLSILWSMSETVCSDLWSQPLTAIAVAQQIQLHSYTDAHRLSRYNCTWTVPVREQLILMQH